MDEDNLPIPEDASEIEFIEQENNQRLFDAGEDLPIDEDVLKQQIAARQLAYPDDELKIIEGTAFKEIMDDMDAKGINYSNVDIYSYIPENERLTPYLIFMEDVRNRWYTDDFVEHLVRISAKGAFQYNIGYKDLPFSPAAQIHEQALNISFRRGPVFFENMLFDVVLDKKNPRGGLRPSKLEINYINDIFPGGSYKAYVEEGIRRVWADQGMTPEGKWLPEIQKQIDENVAFDDIVKNIDTPTNVVDDTSPVLKGREGLPITAEQDRMFEIKWADHWATEGDMWGVQVHGTSTAEVIQGFYTWKSTNPDIPNWWFPRDLINKKQLEQIAFIGFGVSQEDIDDLKEGFEKGIFDIEKDKELLSGINELDGSSMLIKPDTPTNVVDDFGQKGIKWADARKALEDVTNWGDDIPILLETYIPNPGNLPVDKIILEIIPPEGNIEGLIPSEDYRLQASILRENGDIEIIKTYDNPRQFGADGKNFFNDISSIDTPGGSLSGGSLGAAKLNDPFVFDSWVDNLGRTTTSFVDNLPLETVVKNRVKNLITTKTKQLAKPGSLLVKSVDAWEFFVIGLMAAGVAFNEIDEVPKIINNTAINMFNSMTAPYGIAPVEKEEYDIDYEYINTVLDTGTKVMPTDIIIEKLKPYSLEEGEDVILPGTGVTTTTGAEQQFEPYGEELAKRAEKTVNMKRDEVKQDLLESKGVQEEKMFEQAPKKRKPTGSAGAKIL